MEPDRHWLADGLQPLIDSVGVMYRLGCRFSPRSADNSRRASLLHLLLYIQQLACEKHTHTEAEEWFSLIRLADIRHCFRPHRYVRDLIQQMQDISMHSAKAQFTYAALATRLQTQQLTSSPY